MFPYMLFRSCRPDSLRKKKTNRIYVETEHDYGYSVSFDKDHVAKQATKFSFQSKTPDSRNIKMENRVSNFSNLIQRVTASCLLHQLATGRHQSDEISKKHAEDESEDDTYRNDGKYDSEDEEREESFRVWEGTNEVVRMEKATEMEMLMGEVFVAMSSIKRAYVSLQEAHCPWDPEKMRVADVAVVAELRRVGELRERFQKSFDDGGDGGRGRKVVGAKTLREVVAPYEVALEELKREVKNKEKETGNLRKKLKMATRLIGGSGKKGRSHQSKEKIQR